MFDPTKLDGTINGLRGDADSLRHEAAELSRAVASTVWTCPRAVRFRSDFESHRLDLLGRAKELDRIADQVVALKGDVERELMYIKAIAEAVAEFFENVQGAALAAARAVQQAAENAGEAAWNVIKGVATGDLGGVRDGIDDVGSLFREWPWRPIHLPLPGDPSWREVDQYMRMKSGSADAHGAVYRAPSTPTRRT